jgi:hypothetical protein
MKTIRIYSDESRHKNERFMLLSGIWIEEEKVKEATEEIKALRHKYAFINSSGKSIDFIGEFKWQKISTKYYGVYRDLVDILFKWIENDTARFCTMIIDTQEQRARDHGNIETDGYFKLLYQLYYQNSKIPAIYKIFPDSISNPTTKVNLPRLDHCLDIGFKKKFLPLLNPADIVSPKGFVNNITPIDSHSSDLIQMVDVVMGALGYLENRLFVRPEANKYKVELMKYIFGKIVFSGAIMVSGKSYYVARSTKFNIWHFRPKNKKDPQ